MKTVADSLVLYKIRPARVLSVGEKIEIQLEGGQTKRVRPKDIEPLHPGPLHRLQDLVPLHGELEETWELLDGATTEIAELAELGFGEYSPASAWAAWQWVADGLYFEGTPEAITARPRERVDSDRVEREAREKAKREWEAFIDRMRQGRMDADDGERLGEVERVALGRGEHSRILEALGHPVTREHAHRLLVAVGYWAPEHNPWPARFGVNQVDPTFEVPALSEAPRRDLTALDSFAIDDEGNRDPDDAIAVDGERLWVHVADVAALVAPDGPMDLDARARGANLYAPERTVPMLPDAVTERLGLGLQEVSPALSFGLRYTQDGFADVEIAPSWVRVRRVSYEEAETRLEQEPFRSMLALTAPFRAHRHARDAAAITLPEVSVRVVDGEVRIRPLRRLRSRELVTDAMLMAGEAAARFCHGRGIAIPYATQPPPSELAEPKDLAAMWAYRRRFQPSRLSLDPAPHFGLGLDLYTRATSPLRRYSDLLVHQQLRAALTGGTPLEAAEVAARMDLAEAGGLAIRRAERQSNLHWKLAWLRRHPDWSGRAVVVELESKKVVALIPELALDVKVRVQAEVGLNAELLLRPREVDLTDLSAYFSARPA